MISRGNYLSELDEELSGSELFRCVGDMFESEDVSLICGIRH